MSVAIVLCSVVFGSPQVHSQQACSVVQQGDRVELHSPCFVFRLDTVAGLRAESWQNRLTGRTIELGDGLELECDIGLPGESLRTPAFQVTNVKVQRKARRPSWPCSCVPTSRPRPPR